MDRHFGFTTAFRACFVVCLSAATLLVAGCAAAPVAPTGTLDKAQVAIENAQSDDVSHYAGGDLDEARQKLAMAEAAVAAKNMALAEQRAQESIAAAELASARTQAAKADAVNNEMRRSGDALGEEMKRSGEQQ